MFLDLANLSAVTIALPTIQENFGIDAGDLQWIISAYALTFGSFLLLGGRGGDIFGLDLNTTRSSASLLTNFADIVGYCSSA